MKKAALSLLKRIDRTSSVAMLKLFGDRPSVIVLLFHSLFRDEAELRDSVIAPQQGITVEHFRIIIDHYLKEEYLFTDPDEIIEGLEPDRRYILLTFDDGYFNNSRALPVLEHFDVPAVFFVSTSHVLQQKRFWWDILHHDIAMKQRATSSIRNFKTKLKTKKTQEIEELLMSQLGTAIMRPTGDIDRPFTAAELADFAGSRHVHIGNHTSSHAILTNYSAGEVRDEIARCQTDLTEITGEAPTVISYPNGDFSDLVVRIAREQGLQLGITGVTRKNYLPLDVTGMDAMALGRMVPYGTRSLIAQLQSFRSDLSMYGFVKNNSGLV